MRIGFKPSAPAPVWRDNIAVMTDAVERSGLLAEQKNDSSFSSLWQELKWRGLVHVSTDEEALERLLDGDSITYYCGFDPTAPSLHLGNLVQLLLLRRLQLAGHRPLGLVGGSTGLIGDPRPTAERTLNSRETVAEWVSRLRVQVSRFLAGDGPQAVRLVNNLDWTEPISAIDFLREVGKYFRVGAMLKKDAVAARLASSEGISYTEFSYQVLQGFDFLELKKQYGCCLQTGGSDQWGNLSSGVDLIRRVLGESVHAIGTPLITNADGTKFGKSEGNAIWLDAQMCSPYTFYQFWLNQADADVVDRLKVFTFLSRAEIEGLACEVRESPHLRVAQKRLAWEVTRLVHGEEATVQAIAAADALFGRGELRELSEESLRAALRETGIMTADRGEPVSRLLVLTGLAGSVSEARRAIEQGGVYLNNVKVSVDVPVAGEDLLCGGLAVLRHGKKTFAGVDFSG